MTDTLKEAAQAVVNRWDTPLWKDAEATARVINRLREELAAAQQSPISGEGADLVLAPRWVFQDFLDNAPGWPDTARRYLNAPPAPPVSGEGGR